MTRALALGIDMHRVGEAIARVMADRHLEDLPLGLKEMH
jgi:hypothetical protein